MKKQHIIERDANWPSELHAAAEAYERAVINVLGSD
jgi:hypothetical protein